MPSLLRIRSSGEAAVLEIPLPPCRDEHICATYLEAAFLPYHVQQPGISVLCCQHIRCGPACVPLGLATTAQGLHIFMPHKQSGNITGRLLDAERYPLLCSDVTETEKAFLLDGPLLLLFLSGGALHIYNLLQPETAPIVINNHEDLQRPHIKAKKQLEGSALPTILQARTAYGYGLWATDAPTPQASSSSSTKKARSDVHQNADSRALDAQQQEQLLAVTRLRLERLRSKNSVLRHLASQKQAILSSMRSAVLRVARGGTHITIAAAVTLPAGVLRHLYATTDDTPLPPQPLQHPSITEAVEVVEVLHCPEGAFHAIRIRNISDFAVFDITASSATCCSGYSSSSSSSSSSSVASVILPGDEAMLLATTGSTASAALSQDLLLGYLVCPDLNTEEIEKRTLVRATDAHAAYLSLGEAHSVMHRRAFVLSLKGPIIDSERRLDGSFGSRLLTSLRATGGTISIHGFLLSAIYIISSSSKEQRQQEALLLEVLDALSVFVDSGVGQLSTYMLCGSRIAWFEDYATFLRDAVDSARSDPSSQSSIALHKHIAGLGTSVMHCCSSSYTAATCEVLLDSLLDEFKLLSILWRKQLKKGTKRSSNGSQLLFFANTDHDDDDEEGERVFLSPSGLRASICDMRLLLSLQRATDDLAFLALTTAGGR